MTLTYVVDCSLVIDALSARKEDELLRQRLSAPRTLHAPHHLDVEVASTVRGLAAGKKVTDRRGAQMLADYARLRITRHPVWPYHPRMWELRHNLGACDAAYIALAEALRCEPLTETTRETSSSLIFAVEGPARDRAAGGRHYGVHGAGARAAHAVHEAAVADGTVRQGRTATTGIAAGSHAPGMGHDQGHVHEVSLIPEIGIQDIESTSGGTVMAMVKTPVEIDQEALALAAEVLGTKTKKDTVNAALREVGQRLDRLRALARLREMADQGDFDELVGNKASYRR